MSTVGVAAAVTIGLPLLALWAFEPAEPIDIDPAWQPATAPEREHAEQTINYAVFNVELWHTPDEARSTPDVAEAAPEPQLPDAPRLTLIGILTEPSDQGSPPKRRAVLYDPGNDKLVFASAGEAVSSVLVHSIDEATVRLAVADQMYVMPLDGKPGWED